MAMQLGALRDALKEAGVSDAAAAAAAEEVAVYHDRLTGIERRIVEFRGEMTELRAHVDQGFAKLGAEIIVLRGELNTLRWAFGFMFAVQVAILVKLFVH